MDGTNRFLAENQAKLEPAWSRGSEEHAFSVKTTNAPRIGTIKILQWEIPIFLPPIFLPDPIAFFLQIGTCQGIRAGLFSVLLFRDNLFAVGG